MRDSWLRKKTEEIQPFADKGHEEIIIYGPKSSAANKMLSTDGSNLLIDKEAISGVTMTKKVAYFME